MKQACTKEIETFCKDVPHGNARVIRCLQDAKTKKDFGKPCREEVAAYERESGKDYRLNFRLKTACKNDIGAICSDACGAEPGGMCGGRVMRCLSEHKEDIKASACLKEARARWRQPPAPPARPPPLLSRCFGFFLRTHPPQNSPPPRPLKTPSLPPKQPSTGQVLRKDGGIGLPQ